MKFLLSKCVYLQPNFEQTVREMGHVFVTFVSTKRFCFFDKIDKINKIEEKGGFNSQFSIFNSQFSIPIMQRYKFFLYSFLIILIDQAVKLAVKLNMEYDGEIYLLGNARPSFKIHFLENPGAAFGMTIQNFANVFGGEMSPTTAKLILSLFSLLIMPVIGYVLYKVSTQKTLLPLFVSFIFGGAVGNIIDRVFYGVWFAGMNNYQGGLMYGRVVDMFYFDIWEGMLPSWIPLIGGGYMSLWPVFNVADSAISIGIVAILLFQKKFIAQHESENLPAKPVEASADLPTANVES